MHPIHVFKNLSIRYKLLLSYTAAFTLIIAMGSFVQLLIVNRTIERNIENELRNSTVTLQNLVRTAVSVSIQNHLRASAENNLDIVARFHRQYLEGKLSQAEARQQAEVVLLSQRIGKTGYIAVVSSQGRMVVHPEPSWIGVDITNHGFVHEMTTRKKGYLEYDWKNPGEPNARPKAMYISYFEPWDWIITVASYRDEFSELVDIDDFRKSILSLTFGKTGYSFVADSQGNMIIHPQLEGINVFQQDGPSTHPLKQMVNQKTGKIIYLWKNPGEDRFRRKLVIFDYIPQYGWIVASSSYLNEFYSPLRTVSNVILVTLLASLLLVLVITSFISSSITEPLQSLMNQLRVQFFRETADDLQFESKDEVFRLTRYFYRFMDQIDHYGKSLRQEIRDRRQTEDALRVSEEKYRTVMEATPDPIIVYDMEGKVTYMNPAFTRVFDWTLEECLGKDMDSFVPPETWKETHEGIEKIKAGESLLDIETRRYSKAGVLHDVSIRGAVYKDKTGKPIGSVITHRDTTDLRRLERQVMEIGDKERQKIGEDLHDDLCPHLIGIEGLGKVLKRKLETKAPDEAALAGQITELIKEGIAMTRRLSRGLCPVYLVDYGLESALRDLAANTASVFRIPCTFHCETTVSIRDITVATQLFQITKEAVHNAVKHGKAQEIQITLSAWEDKLVITVSDDGIGIPDSLDSPGMGLRIMGFRAKMIDADLDVRRAPVGGTYVKMTVGVNPDLKN